MPLGALLTAVGRWSYLIAIPLAMTTPRIDLGSWHVTLSDSVAVIGGMSWLVAALVSRRRSIVWRAAQWPVVVAIAGLASVVSSVDRGATLRGVVELVALWVLPAVAVPNLFGSSASVDRFLQSVCVGSVIAALINIGTAASVGFAEGIPQVWGAADYYQGYFQVMGIAVAAPRLMMAWSRGKPEGVMWWGTAVFLNAVALLLTQTRGAWLAAAAVLILLVLLWGRLSTIGLVALFVLAVVLIAGADWAEVFRERAESIFSLEASLTGFDSSIIRLALLVTGWRMFLAHPLLGVGLKCFPIMMADYGPPGMPDTIEMGPDRVPTLIEGPHSTYVALLAQAGIVAALGLIAWEFVAARRLLRVYRHLPRGPGSARGRALALVAGVVVVAIFNCFSEMNATGALPLVCFLSLACGAPMTDGEPER